jgi:cytochrome c-type biogenesis protein CcmH
MRFAIALALVLIAAPAFAQPLKPAEEARAQALFHELRCLVCQNQSIAESHAPLAEDLRTLVRERIQAGDSDRAVKDFLVERYGEFVLLRPELTWETLLLWATPVIAILGGAGLAARAMARRRGKPQSEPDPRLNSDEEERLSDLV